MKTKLDGLNYRTTKLALISSVVLLFCVSMVPAAFALSSSRTVTSNTITANPNGIGSCPAQSFLAPPAKPNLLVLNIKWTIQNDEDSGGSGYWALDHTTVNLKVWSLPNGTFYAEKTYTGVFSTPQAAISPGTQASPETESAFGTIKGGYIATFTGQFTPGTQQVKGNLGMKNYGGTTADILLGTYGNGQTGAPNAYDWVTAYFTNVQNFQQPHWGWAYLLNPIFHSTTSFNQWCNYDSGNSGDILT